MSIATPPDAFHVAQTLLCDEVSVNHRQHTILDQRRKAGRKPERRPTRHVDGAPSRITSRIGDKALIRPRNSDPKRCGSTIFPSKATNGEGAAVADRAP